IGATITGNVVFAMPPGQPKSIELRFYDYAHGHFVIPLLGGAEATAAAQAKPLSAPLKNEVVEIAPFAFDKSDAVGDRKAPAGMTFVSVDLRARSTFTVDA